MFDVWRREDLCTEVVAHSGPLLLLLFFYLKPLSYFLLERYLHLRSYCYRFFRRARYRSLAYFLQDDESTEYIKWYQLLGLVSAIFIPRCTALPTSTKFISSDVADALPPLHRKSGEAENLCFYSHQGSILPLLISLYGQESIFDRLMQTRREQDAPLLDCYFCAHMESVYVLLPFLRDGHMDF
jgi:hypothetical protein